MSACPARNHAAWYAAMDNGGQRIDVIPAANVLVVTTSGNYNSAEGDKVANCVLLKVLSPENVARSFCDLTKRRFCRRL